MMYEMFTLPRGPRALIAASASVAVLLLGIGIFLLIKASPFSSKNLPLNPPAENTVALFLQMTPEEWAKINPLLPVLPPWAASQTPVSAALLTLPNGTKEWVTIAAEGAAPQGSNQALSLLAQEDAPLSADAGFHTLLSQRTTSGSWMYLTSPLLKLPAVPEAYQPKQFALTIDTNEARIHLLGPTLPAQNTLLLSPVSPNDSFFALKSPAFAWQALSQFLPHNRILVLRALLETAATDHLGPGISPAHQLPPFLTDAASAERATGSGMLLYAVTQTSPGHDAVLALHESALAQYSQAKRIQTTTKEGYTVDVLEPSTGETSTKTGWENGWNVTRSMSGEKTVLLTAERGGATIVATDASLFQGALTAPTLENDPSTVAVGRLQPADTSFLVTHLVPELPFSKLLSLLPQTKGAIDWNLKAQDSVWTLSVSVESAKTALDSH